MMANGQKHFGVVLLVVIVVFALVCVFRVFHSVDIFESQLLRNEMTRPPAYEKSEGNKNASDFNALFQEIPYALTNCRDLAKKMNLSADFEKDFEEFWAAVKKHGPTMGHCGLPMFRELYNVMQEIAKAPFVKTICETGFNAGHSSFGWLRSNPTAQVYSFDIGTNHYSRPMAAYLQEKFPGRHRVTWGDSRETLPRFREENPDLRCDLILIDGGHYHAVVQSDFENFRHMANPVHILMLDNYPDKRFMWMGNMWERAKRRSELFEFFSCNYWDEDPEGMSFGRYALDL